MTKPQIIAFLRCPSTQIVDLAISMANLTEKEEAAVRICGQHAMTQEAAAEKLQVSVNGLQRWLYSGMKKLEQSWSGVWWIEKLAK